MSANKLSRMIQSWLLVLWLPAAAWAAGEPVTLRVVQARAAGDAMAVYLDLRDADGRALTAVGPDQLTASVGAHAAEVATVKPFRASGEGIAHIFFVDVSKSLDPAQFAHVRRALADWVDGFSAKDSAALLAFGDAVRISVDFTADRSVLKATIGSLKPTDRSTRLNEALMRAMDLGRRGDAALPIRRVVIVLSDGIDDTSGGSTREEVLVRMRDDRVPVYAIGLARPPLTTKKDEGLKSLGTIAHMSGGEYFAAGNGPLYDTYAALRARIGDVLVARIACVRCEGDGRVHPWHLTLTAGTRILTADGEVRLPAGVVPPGVGPASPAANWGMYGTVLLLVAALAATIVWQARRTRRTLSAVQEAPAKIELAMLTQAMPTSGVTPPLPAAGETTMPAVPPRPEHFAIRLAVVSGMRPGYCWEAVVGDETVVGRSLDCGVTIVGDEEVSAHHCGLYFAGGRLQVRDLGSTNGTFVNGVPITACHALSDGDLIRVGRTELRILFGKDEQ